ncbi:hypothetical protein RJ639_019468 [Escallonia herrerae]|uniref:2-(3-amino-3-carboxypropyl)histidine synthase subunit 1 n=1 Tax=Escallonia herrerae TaxID=1293975 RepID=A0AA89AIE1_9ASTE|nr:hypothetical protein RJ639_019468 [Escallonia herrerae]
MDKDDPQLLLLPPSQNPPATDVSHPSQPPPPSPRRPKRFIRNQIPDSILHDPALNAAIAALPANYNFEIQKSVWRVKSTSSKRVALQLPEGLLMYSLTISDILAAFAGVESCLVLGDVTYGACCVDDLSAAALGADLLIHYGHSCLVPVDHTVIPCLYVFVDIKIDVDRLVNTVKLNIHHATGKQIVLAGTIQFGSAIRAAKPELEKIGFRVLVPQSKPLSAGEVLGCTAPTVAKSCFGSDNHDNVVLVFVADGRFHLEAFMIANPRIKAFRYDPYIGSLFLEEYDHEGMKECRMKAIVKAREARNWGIVLGTLGRQGNPRILDRLEKKMREKGLDWTVMLMSEISPARVALFGDSVDAWVQIACPRLSIDWGDAFMKPLLTPFEADIALGDMRGWWERKSAASLSSDCGGDGVDCGNNESGCSRNNGGGAENEGEPVVDYPMDYYAQDGGEWNSCYSKKPSGAVRRHHLACNDNFASS